MLRVRSGDDRLGSRQAGTALKEAAAKRASYLTDELQAPSLHHEISANSSCKQAVYKTDLIPIRSCVQAQPYTTLPAWGPLGGVERGFRV